jgi:hypothetical protein
MKLVMEIVAIVETIQYVCVSAASISAVFGITKWRQEIQYRKYTELAEEMHIVLSQIKDAVIEIRNPFSHEEEGSTRKRQPDETKNDEQLLDRAYVVIERMEGFSDLFSKFRALQYKHIALFGNDKRVLFSNVINIINELSFSSIRLANLWRQQDRISHMTQEERRKHLDELEKMQSIFWQYEPNDEFSKKLDNSLEKFEKGYLDRLSKGKKPRKRLGLDMELASQELTDNS